MVNKIRRGLVSRERWRDFKSKSLIQWVDWNVKQSDIGRIKNVLWPVLSQEVVHWAWTARNEKVHQRLDRKLKARPEQLIQQAVEAQELNNTRTENRSQPKYISWDKPQEGWIKMNVDGAAKT